MISNDLKWSQVMSSVSGCFTIFSWESSFWEPAGCHEGSWPCYCLGDSLQPPQCLCVRCTCQRRNSRKSRRQDIHRFDTCPPVHLSTQSSGLTTINWKSRDHHSVPCRVSMLCPYGASLSLYLSSTNLYPGSSAIALITFSAWATNLRVKRGHLWYTYQVWRCDEVWWGVMRCDEVWWGVMRCDEVWWVFVYIYITFIEWANIVGSGGKFAYAEAPQSRFVHAEASCIWLTTRWGCRVFLQIPAKIQVPNLNSTNTVPIISICRANRSQDAKAAKRKEADALPAVEDAGGEIANSEGICRRGFRCVNRWQSMSIPWLNTWAEPLKC